MSKTTPPTPNVLYFCDESSFVNELFMAVGGLAVPIENLAAVLTRLKKAREGVPDTAEIKWVTTRERTLEVRKAYVDCLVELIEARKAHFHIRFSPLTEYDHDGPRGEFDTASKSFYQLLVHRAARFYGTTAKILVRPDDGECTSALPGFATHIGRKAAETYNGVKADCIKDIICRDSRLEPLLQLLDVSLGALTAYRNERHERDSTSAAKAELAVYAFDAFGKFGLKDIKLSHDPNVRFSVWNVTPSRKRDPGG